LLRNELLELHYITPISNLPSIFEHGLLSHSKAARLIHQSVASPTIQALRGRRVPGGMALHNYVNLYFHARNPMMMKRQGLHQTLCVLRVSPDVLDIPGTVVTDQNAASSYARFAEAPHGLTIVDRERTFAEDWRDSDHIAYFRKKAAKCAEVLVPHNVPAEQILGAYVSGTAGHDACTATGVACPVTMNAHMFLL
jgi:hypothetical protein